MVSGSLEVKLQEQSDRVREIEREFEVAQEEVASATLQLERIHAQQTARVPAARDVTGRDAMREPEAELALPLSWEEKMTPDGRYVPPNYRAPRLMHTH